MIVREKPCKECPFTKHSMRGFFGPYRSVAELIYEGTEDDGFPCHIDLQDNMKHLCAGSLHYMRNTAKLPRNKEVAKAVKDVAEDSEVFKTRQEMVKFHDIGVPAQT